MDRDQPFVTLTDVQLLDERDPSTFASVDFADIELLMAASGIDALENYQERAFAALDGLSADDRAALLRRGVHAFRMRWRSASP